MSTGAGPRSSPAAARNAAPIGRVVADWFSGQQGTLLEVGCGTGEHAAALSAHTPGLCWLPTDLEPDVATILAWRDRATHPGRVAAPAALDVRDAARWRAFDAVDAVLSINTLHIMAWEAVCALFRNAATVCREDARLAVYGPMHVGGSPTGPGNEAFDRSLRAQGAGMGIRDIEAVRGVAGACGWIELAHYRMPADNQMLVWRRAAA